jgi:hypothetical protein
MLTTCLQLMFTTCLQVPLNYNLLTTFSVQPAYNMLTTGLQPANNQACGCK